MARRKCEVGMMNYETEPNHILHSSFCIHFLPSGKFLELGIDLGQLGFVQAQLGDAAFVVATKYTIPQQKTSFVSSALMNR